MEFIIHEVVPVANNRSELGRVVVDPPKVRGPLKNRRTGKIYMCCNRAFLTEEAYRRHAEEKKEHSKPLDFSKFPKPKFKDTKVPRISHGLDRSSRKLWRVRKDGCTNDLDADAENADRDVHVDDKLEKARAKVCPQCGIKVYHTNLRRHILHSHVPDGIKCDYCSCSFLLNASRLKHQLRVHKVRAKQKSIVARAKKQLAVSLNSVSLKKLGKRSDRFACSVCGKGCHSKSGLRDHMNTHSGVRPYKCEICGFRFNHKANLGRHQRKAHTKNDKIFCTICSCSFARRALLLMHNKIIHSNKLKANKLGSPVSKVPDSSGSNEVKESNVSPDQEFSRLQCPAPNSSGLYECQVCQKGLSTPQTWRGHMRIHQNLKPYKCKFCDSSFRLHSTLSNHIRCSHSGGKFKCKQCTCRFQTQKPLDRHIRWFHSDKIRDTKNLSQSQKPIEKRSTDSPRKSDSANVAGFKCNLCGIVVRLLADFEVHKTLHNGTNRTQCNLCLKQLTSVINLKAHKERAHGDAKIHVHGCTFCCCRYKVSQALFSHLAKEHGMERDDWDFNEKTIKPGARKRIQMKLCQFDPKKVLNGEDSKKTNDLKDEKTGNATTEVVENQTDATGKNYECNICHMRFKVRRSIWKHMKIAHNQGAYVCGICPCRYNKLTWLKKHQLKAHGRLKLSVKMKTPEAVQPNVLKNISCDLCQLTFTRPEGLAKHKKKSHFHSGKFKCHICTCKFKTPKGLEVHLSLHLGKYGRRHQSNSGTVNVDAKDDNEKELNKGIASDESNGKHLNDAVFLSEKRYECDLCHTKFTSTGAISKHKKIAHVKSGMYKCSKCTCRFMTPGGLLVHKRHHVEKGKKSLKIKFRKPAGDTTNFKKASKTFNTKQSHNDDTGTGAEESLHKKNKETKLKRRRIKCDLCSCMILREGISMHKKSAHGSGTYSCPDCTCVFKLATGLTRHRIVFHAFEANHTQNKEEKTESDPGSSPAKKAKVNLNFLKIRSPLSRRGGSKKLRSPVKPVKHDTVKPVKHVTVKPVKHVTVTENDKVEVYPTNTPRPASAATNYRFKCERCGIKFTHISYLRRHQRKAHTEGGIPCDVCSCTFDNSGALAAHKRVYHSPMAGNVAAHKPSKKIAVPKLRFEETDTPVDKRENKVQNGPRSKSQVSPSASDQISETDEVTSIDTRTRTRHSKVETSVSPQSTEPHAKPEKSSNPQQESHQCTWCCKVFPSVKLLEKHILSHTRPEFCRKCNMRFRTKDEVSKHIKVAHDPSSNFQCPVCSCRFATPTGLKAHNTLIHKKKSASYDNIEIIQDDEGAEVGSEPFIQVGPSYPQQNVEEDDFCEESEPIIQGILEAYPSNGFESYNHEQNFQNSEKETMQDVDETMEEEVEESEPIIQGILGSNGITTSYIEATFTPTTPQIRKTFSPKSRPIKCSSCGLTCYGPENLRIHTKSHHQEPDNQGDDVMQVDPNSHEYQQKKCDKCDNVFQTGQELTQHVQLEHDETGLYRCAYCSCTMKTETNLRYHFMKYHSG